MTISISTYLKNKITNHVLRNTSYSAPASVWIALYTSNPTDNNTGTEVSGNSYARVEAPAFNIGASGSAINNGIITFPETSGSWGTITHFGIFNAATSGSLLFFGPFSSNRYVDIGETFFIRDGNMALSFGGAYSYYLAGELLDHILNGNTYSSPGTSVYAALYTTLPDADDAGGVEVSASDYSRLQIAGTGDWNSPVHGSTSNVNSLEFVTGAAEDWGTIVGICLRDSATTGEILFRGYISPPATVITGDTYMFNAEQLRVSSDYGASTT